MSKSNLYYRDTGSARVAPLASHDHWRWVPDNARVMWRAEKILYLHCQTIAEQVMNDIKQAHVAGAELYYDTCY